MSLIRIYGTYAHLKLTGAHTSAIGTQTYRQTHRRSPKHTVGLPLTVTQLEDLHGIMVCELT